MDNKLENLPGALVPTSMMVRKTPPVAMFPSNIRNLCYVFGQQSMKSSLDKAKEALKSEVETWESVRYCTSVHRPWSWMRIYINHINEEYDGDYFKAKFNPYLAFIPKEAAVRYAIQTFGSASYLGFEVETKEQGTQTDPCELPCLECLRERENNFTYNGVRPSYIGLASPFALKRDMAVEAPQRTYESRQMIYFRIGNFIYRGWYKNIPRIPQGILIDELRVEKPLRTQGLV